MTDADNGGDVTLCEVVYDVRGISWTDDDNSRRRPNKYDNVPYRHRLFLTDQEIKQQQKHRRLCERTERRFFRLHGRRGKTLIDERGFALIDNDAVSTVDQDDVKDAPKALLNSFHMGTQSEMIIRKDAPRDEMTFITFAGINDERQRDVIFRRYPWLIGRWPFTEEHRLHWIDEMNQWVLPQGEHPVSYLNVASSVLKTQNNGLNNMQGSSLPEPSLPCPRFLDHMHLVDESTAARRKLEKSKQLEELARRHKAQLLLEKYEQLRLLKMAKEDPSGYDDEQNAGDGETKIIGNNNEERDIANKNNQESDSDKHSLEDKHALDELNSTSKLSKRTKKSDSIDGRVGSALPVDDALEQMTDDFENEEFLWQNEFSDHDQLVNDIDELLKHDIENDLIYETEDVLLQDDDPAEEVDILFGDRSSNGAADGKSPSNCSPNNQMKSAASTAFELPTTPADIIAQQTPEPLNEKQELPATSPVRFPPISSSSSKVSKQISSRSSRRSRVGRNTPTTPANLEQTQETETVVPSLPPLPKLPDAGSFTKTASATSYPPTDVQKRTRWRAQPIKKDRMPAPPAEMTFVGRIRSTKSIQDEPEKDETSDESLKATIEPIELPPLPTLPPLPVLNKSSPENSREQDALTPLVDTRPLQTDLHNGRASRGPKKIDRSYQDELNRQKKAEERRMKAKMMFDKLRNKKARDALPEGGDDADYEEYGWLAQYCILNDENVEMFQRTFINLDEYDHGRLTLNQAMAGLRSLNIRMTDAQEEYMIRILELVGYPVKDGVDFRLFAIMAALSQRIASVDEWVINLLGLLDFRMLEMKTFLCRTLWESCMDKETKKLPIDNLCVELRAGGVGLLHEKEVRDKLGHLVALDLLDFLTYMPLFIMLHQSVISNPLDDSRDK